MTKLVIYILTFTVLAISYVLHNTVNKEYAPIPKLTQAWSTKPIVSVYVPSAEQAGFCNSDYEHMSIRNDFAVSSVSEGPCGCAQNSLSLHSTNAKCPVDLESSDSCMSLSALSQIPSATYRGSGICIKRGGVPAATVKNDKYHSRPHLDQYGACPAEFKKCGSICFPTALQCPVTNMMFLPINESTPAGQGWERSGIFLDDLSILYVRRDQPNEMPIVDVVARLTELTAQNANGRGECYEGPTQVLKQPLVSDPNYRWSYKIVLPPKCNLVDPRYHLFDSVDLERHFLHNLHIAEPTCRAHDLYSVADDRYKSVHDPDYLNSGVKCGSDPRFPCLRDPYQHTNCAHDDDICDGVVNQNICGAYAHAVRSAFAGSSVTLGLYFAREVEWSDHCVLSKKYVSKDAMDTFNSLGWFYLVIMFLAFGLVADHHHHGRLKKEDCEVFCLGLVIPTYWLVQELRNISFIRSGECTDPFTMNVLLTGLQDRHRFCLLLHLLIVICIAIICCLLPQAIVRPLPAPAYTSANVAPRATHTSARAVPTTAVRRASPTVSNTPTTTAAVVANADGSAGNRATTTAGTTSVVATPVQVQMVHQDRHGEQEPLLQSDHMV